MKTALITGGLGFVGSHLADTLLSQGYRVTIVDSLLSNVMAPDDYKDRCEVFTAPIEDVFQSLMPGAGRHFDEIYHLACVVGPAAVLDHAGDMTRSVVYSGEAVIDLAMAHRSSLLVTSTSEVYGRSGRLSEADDCIVPSTYTARLEYAVAKLATEVAAINRARVTDLQVNVVRPFNIAGPRQLPDGGFVLPRFVISALTGRPLTVFGDGTQIRAFTDVRDIVSGLIAVVRSGRTKEIFNIGNPANEISMLDLANRVNQIAGSNAEVSLVDPKTIFGPLYAEGFERVPIVNHALETLDWNPAFSMDLTIAETLEWYRKRPELLDRCSLPRPAVLT